MAETTWGETIIVDVTAVKPQEHIMELRNAVNRYRTHYGLAAKTFTDSDPTVMRKPYIDELRAQMDYLHKQAFNWTDPTITAGVTPVRKVHMDQLRSNMNHLETDHCWTCDLCNTEGCSSCVSDSGCGACDTHSCAAYSANECYVDPETCLIEHCNCYVDAGCDCDFESCNACHTAYNRIG